MLARSWRLSLYGLDLPVDRVSADYVGSNFCHGFWILFFGNFLPLRSLILVGGGRGAGFRCRQHNRYDSSLGSNFLYIQVATSEFFLPCSSWQSNASTVERAALWQYLGRCYWAFRTRLSNPLLWPALAWRVAFPTRVAIELSCSGPSRRPPSLNIAFLDTSFFVRQISIFCTMALSWRHLSSSYHVALTPPTATTTGWFKDNNVIVVFLPQGFVIYRPYTTKIALHYEQHKSHVSQNNSTFLHHNDILSIINDSHFYYELL